MKKLYAVWVLCLLFSLGGYNVVAQPKLTVEWPKTINSWQIGIGYHKTTNLIFPYAIKSVDRGSSAVLVQKAKGMENILQVKAGKKGFDPTNLSVVTTDGKFYSFLVNYDGEPTNLNISFIKNDLINPVQITGQVSESELEKESFKVHGALRFMGIRKNQQLLCLSLHGIFLSDNNMWFRMQVKNRSQIDFHPDYVRFFLRDMKKSKRTAIQETEIFPIYSNTTETIKGLGYGSWAIAFQPFTIPENQRLIIQVGEQNGGRSIILRVKYTTILKARLLP